MAIKAVVRLCMTRRFLLALRQAASVIIGRGVEESN